MAWGETNSASRLLMRIPLMLQHIIVKPILQPLSLLHQLCVLVRIIDCLKQSIKHTVIQYINPSDNNGISKCLRRNILPDDRGNAHGDSS